MKKPYIIALVPFAAFLVMAATIYPSSGGGGTGGTSTFNNNQFSSSGGTTNIKSGALETNVVLTASGSVPITIKGDPAGVFTNLFEIFDSSGNRTVEVQNGIGTSGALFRMNLTATNSMNVGSGGLYVGPYGTAKDGTNAFQIDTPAGARSLTVDASGITHINQLQTTSGITNLGTTTLGGGGQVTVDANGNIATSGTISSGSTRVLLDPGSGGLAARTALGTTTARTIVTASAASGQLAPLTISNGDGASGNPSVDVSTAPSGAYVLFPRDFTLDSVSALGFASANVVYVYRKYFPCKITITILAYRFDATAGSSHYAFAVYSNDGNTKLLDTGAVDGSTGGSAYTAKSVSSTTLLPGYYWVAWTADSTSETFRSISSSAVPMQVFYTGTAQMGTAANASTSGAMPSALGAITGAALNIPILKFE